MVYVYVVLYLAAIVAANLAVATWGPSVIPYTAFFLIGLDLTARDKLHDLWHGNKFILKMGALIATGSILSWFLNKDAGIVALASFLAFTAAAVADTLMYQLLYRQNKLLKMNGSNLVSATVDSVVFPTVAFGVFLPEVILMQLVVKVFGGLFWSLVFNKQHHLGSIEPFVREGTEE